MKLWVIAFLSLLLTPPGSTEKATVDVPENIKCGARNCFNPENWNFYHQWDRLFITDYVGNEIGCEINRIKTIQSNMNEPNYKADWIFQYDKQRHLLLQQSNSSSGRVYTIRIQYNENGKPVSVNDDGHLTTINYPSPGISIQKRDQILTTTITEKNRISSSTINKMGLLDNRTIKVFDDQKRLVSKTDSFTYNHSKTTFTYSYNEKGLVISLITDFGKDCFRSFRKYNDYGWIELDSTIVNPRNTLVVHYKYEIATHPQGLTITQHRLYSDSSGSPLTYTFDKWGNWIEKKNYSSLMPVKTEIRKITYW